MELRHLVVGQIEHGIAVALQRVDERLLVGAGIGDLHAHEDVRVRVVGVAVVELGDRAVADELAKAEQAPGTLRNGHREQALAVLAELGPLGDVAETVEVHVRSAHDGREPLAGHALALDVALQARHPERACGLPRSTGCPRRCP